MEGSVSARAQASGLVVFFAFAVMPLTHWGPMPLTGGVALLPLLSVPSP